MAARFLKQHGIDLHAEMERIQFGSTAMEDCKDRSATIFRDVSLPSTTASSRWRVSVEDSKLSEIVPETGAEVSTRSGKIDGQGALLAPSFCHPHVHIDKAYLLSHPKYAHLQIEQGDFQEAMSMTGKAKAVFEEWDLLERGQRLIDESVEAGVTHMRAFVELDAGVGRKCLDAGIKLKRKAAEDGQCVVQLCAFAQLPLFSQSQDDDDGSVIRGLMQNAANATNADVVGSTPYVETDKERMEKNIEWMVDLSIESDKHLDFHLDYNLDPNTEPMIWHVIKTLKEKKWKERTKGRTVVLGHCTRLTLFEREDWQKLKEEMGDLPISFVGLPTSDLFMMRTPERTRGTLDILTLIKEYGFNACLGINNIGNAFTPHGCCDPLTLACNGVAIYQAGTKQDAELLYECISTRAKRAIGLGRMNSISGETEDEDSWLTVRVGDQADLLLFGSETLSWRTRKSVSEAVYLYDHCKGRRAFLKGVPTNGSIRPHEKTLLTRR